MLRGIVLMGALAVFAPFAAFAEDIARQVVVTGHGQVAALPDMAEIRLGVTHEDREAVEAMDQVSEDMRRLFEALQNFGIAERDIQTSTLRLDPLWDNGSRSTPRDVPRITGFVAHNEVNVRLRDIARLGELLDILLRDGANRFSGVNFAVKSPEPLVDEARRRAVADAARKAELYARAAGIRLGPVLEIREPGASAGPGPRMSRMEPVMAEAMPVAAGELSFGASITIVYGIAD